MRGMKLQSEVLGGTANDMGIEQASLTNNNRQYNTVQQGLGLFEAQGTKYKLQTKTQIGPRELALFGVMENNYSPYSLKKHPGNFLS